MGDITLGVATSKAQIDGGTISGVTSLTTPTSSVIGLYGAERAWGHPATGPEERYQHVSCGVID
jgi:hypothetical protein